MTTDDSPYQMSQGLEVLRPRSGKAYPIPCEEWELLKQKIGRATTEPWFFHTLGSILLGAGLSAFIPIVTNSFVLPAQNYALGVTWVVAVSASVCGVVCLLFAQKEKAVHRERASDVVAQMQLIEHRYERAST